MGFKNLLNSKKILSLLAVFMLAGTDMLFAQGTEASGAAATDAPKDNGLATAGYYVLMFLVVCFFIGIIGKVFRVYDLTQQVRGKQPMDWNNIMGVMFLIFLIAGLYGVYWSFTTHGSMILPSAASEHGGVLDTMFWTTTGITMPVFIITQILLFSFLFRYRYNAKRRGHFLPHNNTIEKVWTIAPAIVLTVLVIFGFFTWQSIMNSVDAKGQPASINIDITGHQFAWELRYTGKDGRLGKTNYKLVNGTNKLGIDFTDKASFDDLQADTMVIPVNKSVRLNIHSQDVIHSVYIPHFRVQLNAVPGMPTYFKFKPILTTTQMRAKLDKPDFEYEVLCNKICGGSHYNMKKIVRVVSEAEYQAWLVQQKPYLTDKLKQKLHFAEAPAATDSTKVQGNRLALNN